jgi:transposase
MKTEQKLQQEVTELKAVIQQKDTQLERKNTLIKNLEAALIDLKKHRFGSSSEKQNNKDQLPLFNEIELIDDTKIPPKSPKKKNKTGKRDTLPDNLERINKEHDLDESQKKCPHDQSELKHIGNVTTEQLYFKPAVIKVIKHIQYKYACQCCGKYIITAKKPKEIIPKSIATAEILSYITISKYADALPLYRLTNMFKRLNVKISRQNMANWMIKCSIAVQPLVNMIQDELYNQPCVHIDETPIQVLKEPGKKAQTKSYMWVQRAGDNIVFNYHPNRSTEIIEELIENYSGAIMTDGYGAYDKVTDKHSIKHLGCWVHARRYFIKVTEQGENPNAQKIIRLIGKLYLIEKQIKSKEPDKIYQHRQNNSLPIIKNIREHLDTILHTTTPAGLMGKAIHYLNNQWPKLIAYTDDGHYPIDNNTAENAIRPFVVGRKNWLFSNTPSGAHASANMYSLIETAKAHGLNPQEYLNHVYKEIPLVESIEGYEKLLPWNYKPDNTS